MNPLVQAAIDRLPADARILDCGGWFIPLAAATHVADIMPYETRGGMLQLAPLPGERFTKETWHQVDFLAPDFRFPFPDKFFAFSYCSHTIEDLTDPTTLLRELVRVSRAGFLASPSRLREQTAGICDRMTSRQGYPHHHWILETVNGRAMLSHKSDSLDDAWWQTAVPLRVAEYLSSAESVMVEWTFFWTGEFEWEVVCGPAAQERAVAFARNVGAHKGGLAFDWLVRKLRHAKYTLKNRWKLAITDWWRDMVRLSQPYSRLPLK